MQKLFSRSPDRVLALLLALGALLLYLKTLAPGVLDGDSGEWQYMANILGVPHSTGYPFYVLLAKLFTLLPFGNPAWRVNLFSAVCAALVVPIVYELARRVSHSRSGSLLAAALFALAPTLWASATQAEVYALNTLLIALTLYFAICWYDTSQARDLCATAFLFGLALTNHRVALFIAPGLLLLIFFRRHTLNPKRVGAALLLLLAPLLLYLYIPLRASQLLAEQSAENWALYPRAEAILNGEVSAYYNHSLYGFFNLITAFDNRNKLGFQDAGGGATLLPRVTNSASLLLQQFGPVGIVLALAGIILVVRRERALALMLLAAALGVSAISVLLRGESTQFYFSGAYLVLATFVAAAAGALIEGFRARPLARGVAIALLALLPLTSLWSNYARLDESNDTRYDVWARSVLSDNLAPNAVVIAPWEIATPLRYFQLVEGERPDLLLIHESPVRPQFGKILVSAHNLARPFYYVQFTPEDKTISAVRTVQAVPLPLTTPPTPTHTLNVPLTDSISVLGYDLKPESMRSGEWVRLALYYQVTAPVNSQFTSELELDDIRGQMHGTWSRLPVSDYYPTYFWKSGEYYRDVWDIPMPADAPRGLYNFQLAWYPYDPTNNTTNRDEPHTLTIGPLRGGDFAAGNIPHTQIAQFENGMQLLGFGLSGSAGVMERAAFVTRRNSPLTVSLFWQTNRQLDTSYTVFLHLVDENGIVRLQSDRPPWNGMYPTDRWKIGEMVRDEYTLDLPGDLAPGTYHLVAGIYSNPEAPALVAVRETNSTSIELNIPVGVTAEK